MEQKIKIAVIGGTGKAGKYLVGQLVKEGYKIKVLTRNPDRLEEQSTLVEKVTGDATDYESVHKLINGCYAVISTLGQRKGENPVFAATTGNIIKAMNSLQLKRYILLTGLTLDTPDDKKSPGTKFKSFLMKILFGKIILDKQNEYNLLLGSDLDWTIVRVPFIEMTDKKKHVEVSLTDCSGNKISTADLACFLTEQITGTSYIRKAPFIWNRND
jgi:putative NADH-flavin reductase